ncbi:YbaB/EbfC family nucleoid-associated protein [Planctomycetaceae bacterium SH139]
MFKGLAGMASMMGNLQQLPDKLEAINERLRQEQVSGQSSCGRVSVIMNGLGELQSIDVSPALVEGGNPSPAAEPTCEAVNVASKQAKARYGEAMREMASDMNLNLPGVDGLLSRMTGGSGG